MTGVPAARRAGMYAALALVAAMLIGGAAGYALGRRAPVRRDGPDVTLLGLSRGALLDSLRVTGEQRAAIEGMLQETSQRAEATVRAMMRDIRAMTGETRRQVSELLDAEQRQRFDSIMATAAPVRMRTPMPPGGRPPQPPRDSASLPRRDGGGS